MDLGKLWFGLFYFRGIKRLVSIQTETTKNHIDNFIIFRANFFLFSYQIYLSWIEEMIEKIQIRNFGTHKKLNVEFSPLVNSIIGRNASGKSTIIRAIKWAGQNRPVGNSMIRWEEDRASVRLVVDGHKITRIKNKNTNIYKLDSKSSYKAFRNDVPKDIKEIVNFSDINFQGQHEAPFWFCKTAGEVSRQLNAIINLEIIDRSLSNIDSAMRESQVVAKVIAKRLEDAELRQNSYAYVNKMDSDLQIVESAQNLYQKKAVESARLRDFIKLVQTYRSERKNSSKLVSRGNLVLSKGRVYQKLGEQTKKLAKTIKLGESFLISINKNPLSFNRLEVLKKKQESISNQCDLFESLISKVETCRKIKCQTEKDLKKCKQELDKVAGERCPLCGKKMKKL